MNSNVYSGAAVVSASGSRVKVEILPFGDDTIYIRFTATDPRMVDSAEHLGDLVDAALRTLDLEDQRLVGAVAGGIHAGPESHFDPHVVEVMVEVAKIAGVVTLKEVVAAIGQSLLGWLKRRDNDEEWRSEDGYL